MRETLGSQGVQTLLGKLKDQEKKTEDAEKKGEQAENKGTLDSYDSAITDAAQKSEEAKKEQEQQKNQGDFSDAGNGDDFTGGVDESVENPIPIIRRVRKMGLLDLVVPCRVPRRIQRLPKHQKDCLLIPRRIPLAMVRRASGMPQTVVSPASNISRAVRLRRKRSRNSWHHLII